MELPLHLKNLYRHWKFHGIAPQRVVRDPFVSQRLKKEIEAFVSERMAIWKKKTRGEAAPYTTDPILSSYRFCNILWEFDKQTIEFHTLLNPLRDDFELWLLNMFYCRMVARPETIKATGLLSFNEKENKEFSERLIKSPRPRFGTPYVFPISTIMRSETPTRELFISFYLPLVMKKVAALIKSWEKESVYDGVSKILPMFGYNLNFLWTEVLIDVAYQFPHLVDLYKQFPIGPGSTPTMKRIHPEMEPSLLVRELAELPLDIGITFEGKPVRLSAENWEGIGCEFRKYTNLGQGKGRKRLYV